MSLSVALALVVSLGVGAQWLAWRLRVPSILILLATGVLVGPLARGLGWSHSLDTQRVFGDLLLPLVSICVALILFEGGLTLRFRDLPGVGGVIRNLVTVGALATWGVAAVAARVFLGFPWELALLLGALLTVTGPTVIQPLIRHIRPTGSVGNVLRWEGIVIDPIGALLAVLTYEVILAGELALVPRAVLATLLVGGGLGLVGAWGLVVCIRRFWLPDHLQTPAAIALCIAAFVGANAVQHEAGLFAVTVLGIALANQRAADLTHIVEFKENLTVLLISILFIMLSARLEFEQLQRMEWGTVAFVATLILVARPLGVLLSTLGSRLSWRERLFLAWMAPRGIVAAAISSIFALRLAPVMPAADDLVAATFGVIVGTVTVYGLTAPWLARRLGLADRDPQGLLIVGAQRFNRLLAQAIVQRGVRVMLCDVNPAHTAEAAALGLPTHTGSAVGEGFLDDIDLAGIGQLVAATPSDSVNSLVAQRLARHFGKRNVFQLHPKPKHTASPHGHAFVGRILFQRDLHATALERRLDHGHTLTSVPVTAGLSLADLLRRHGSSAVLLAVVTKAGKLNLSIDAASPPPLVAPGDTAIVLAEASVRGKTESTPSAGGPPAATPSGTSPTPPLPAPDPARAGT